MLKHRYRIAILDVVLKNPQLGSFVLFLLRAFSFSRIDLKIVRLEGLSETRGYRTKMLRPGVETTTYGPNFGFSRQCSATVKSPESWLYEFRDARVSTLSSTLLLENGTLLADGDLNDSENRIDYSQGHLRRHFGARALVRNRTTHRLQKGLFLAGNGSFNYYHWLIEILPKVEFLTALPAHLHSHPLLVPECITRLPAFEQSLAIMAGSREVVRIAQDDAYLVEDLAFINAASRLPFNLNGRHALQLADVCIDPRSIAFIRMRTLVASLPGNPRPKPGHARIFLCRKGVRRSYNQEDVSVALSRHGFVAVYMEDLSFEEQVLVMQNADVIAGPSGGAWANLAFAKQGAKALCWMAEEAGEFSPYSTIAKLVGVDLKYMTYRAGVQSAFDLYANDYVLDLGELEASVTALNL